MKNNKTPFIIEGGVHLDQRGSLSFINDFSLEKIKRFYIISHPRKKTVRAWQGHKILPKYFYVISGSFWIACVEIDNWQKPSRQLDVSLFKLESVKPSILCIPPGFANGIKAIVKNSQMISFCEDRLDEYPKDNYRYDSSLWLDWNDLD